jgi:hypothetical protein
MEKLEIKLLNNNGRGNNRNFRNHNQDNRNMRNRQNITQGNRVIQCYNCGENGHISWECGRNNNNNYNRKECSECGRMGHNRNECFRNKTCKRCGDKGHTETVCSRNIRRVNYVDYEDEDDNEIYVTTRSGKKYGEVKQSESPKENNIRRKVRIEDDEMDIDEEKLRVRKYREKSRFDNVEPYDIAKDLENARANISIAQLLKESKRIEKELKNATRRRY